MPNTRTVSKKPDTLSPLRATLPVEMLDKATGKLGWVSLIAAASTVFIFAVEGMLQPEIRALQGTASVRSMGLMILFLSVGVLVLRHTGVLSKQTLLNVGVLYQVAVAFGISMFENSLPMNDVLVLGVSNVAVWIWLCGTLIHNTPILSLCGSLGCASMWGLAHFVSCQWHGYSPLPPNRILSWTAPLVLCAAWVSFLNKRAVKLQIRQQQAEDMGAYQLVYQIGMGGMGEVWRASHRMLARDSAIKLIRTDVLLHQSDRRVQMMRKRFEREARVTASLKSPHTVALYDFGVAQDGSFYYVMELLNGLDLQTFVERFGPLPPARVVHVLRQVCLSLEEAHRAGLVHRDIKPRNIFLCSFGLQYDFAKVLDFGLVKSNGIVHEAHEVTTEGTVTGTPAYMPPEIAMGRSDVDGRADIYSLGCVAYYLLTGSLVFDENSATAMTLAHVQKSVVPPSQRTESQIPGALERLVLACLEKEPTARPRSAQELSHQLHSLPEAGSWAHAEAADWWHSHLPKVGENVSSSHTQDTTATLVPTAA